MSNEKKMVREITSMDVDFSKWYTDIIKKAELAEYSSIKGCMIIRPYGFKIWENIQDVKHKNINRSEINLSNFIILCS
ncbi:Prolyl-tRNA synthetase [Candidatus Arthromitus sp. SFB-5]|nr:Prolyl-tRNA synthetase [Candidatus Arthromitus sp. SFB-5]